ncbi:MAG: hypothetical protein ACPGQL_00260 [Thermoplasmatota archaeon]
MAAATTPCPHCKAPVPLPDGSVSDGACPACDRPLRFIDAPEHPCASCSAPVVRPPGQDAVRCPDCGHLQATDPQRPLQIVTPCPRCRRRIPVPGDASEATCPHCAALLRLAHDF